MNTNSHMHSNELKLRCRREMMVGGSLHVHSHKLQSVLNRFASRMTSIHDDKHISMHTRQQELMNGVVKQTLSSLSL